MRKEKIHIFQGAVSTVTAWFVSKLGMLFSVLVILIIMMVLDQISGLLASGKESLDYPDDKNYGWSSAKFRKGIYKKMGYILTIMVAMVADYLIFNIADHIGVHVTANTMFGLLVSVWFILNELLSILENAGRMGAELPEF